MPTAGPDTREESGEGSLMPWEGENRRRHQRWKISPEINVGNMLTIIGMICAFGAVVYAEDKRITAGEERDRLRDAVDAIKDVEQKAKEQRGIDSINELKVEVAKTNTKLDGLKEVLKARP